MEEGAMKKTLLISTVFMSILLIQCKTLTPVYFYKTTGELEAKKKNLQATLEETNAGIATLEAAIAHHTKTKQAMLNALKEAKAQGKQPDVKKLKALATATGHRSEHFQKAPKLVKGLIDEYETRLANWVQGLTTAPALAGLYGPNYGHYIQEIARTYEFIQLMEKEKSKLLSKKAEVEAEIKEVTAQIEEREKKWKSGVKKASGDNGNGGGNGGY